MKQVFIFGASSVYGVGAEDRGWGDLVKSYIHQKMYGEGGWGETHEVFNFAKSGSTIEFVGSTYRWVVENYRRNNTETIALVSVGGNDAKADNDPGNFVCTPEDFKVKIGKLLSELQTEFDHVIFVGNGYVDESKTFPKQSPFSDHVSYFSNERRQLFGQISKNSCEQLGIDYVSIPTNKDDWLRSCLSKDGLHPNQTGYDKMFEAIRPVLERYL